MFKTGDGQMRKVEYGGRSLQRRSYADCGWLKADILAKANYAWFKGGCLKPALDRCGRQNAEVEAYSEGRIFGTN